MVEGRSGDDHYMMFTGGTTGLPKGVVWRQEDAFFNCMGGGDPSRLAGPISTPAEILDRVAPGLVYMPVAPMMHAAAQWTTFLLLFAGGKAVLMPGWLDPEAVWQAVQDERANSITLVGDAVGRPMIDVLGRQPRAVGHLVPLLDLERRRADVAVAQGPHRASCSPTR